MQQSMLEYDEREGQVLEYLDTLLPEGWYDWPTYKRVDFFQQHDELSGEEEGVIRREAVCSLEIFCECFGRPKSTWKKQDAYEIAGIMARLPGWERTGERRYIGGYGRQRPFTREPEDGTSHGDKSPGTTFGAAEAEDF